MFDQVVIIILLFISITMANHSKYFIFYEHEAFPKGMISSRVPFHKWPGKCVCVCVCTLPM